MRHFLAGHVLAVLLAVPVAAFGQHHHSSGGLGGLGGLFGGGSSPFQPQHHSQPMFQPQHHQPAFQPQHHQNNQPMFGGQNGQNRSNGFQQNFQPQPQTYQANRPVTSQPQTGQLNRTPVMNHGTGTQPQVSNSGPAHHHSGNSQQGNVSSQSNVSRPLGTLSTNSTQGQQGRLGSNSQGTAGVLSNKSNAGNNSTGNRPTGGVGGLTTNGGGTAATGNRTHGGTGVSANPTVGTNVVGNRSNTNNGTSNSTAVLSNRTAGANSGGSHPGHPGSGGNQAALIDAKATAERARAQADNQKSNTGVVQTSAQSATTNGSGNRNVPQNNPSGPRSNTTGIATNGQRGGAVNANMAAAGTSSNTGGIKSLPNTTGGGHTRGHGSLATGSTDVRKTEADKRAHDIAQQQAIKQRSQSSASATTSTGKPGGIVSNSTAGKTPGNSATGKTPGNSTIANSTAGHPGGNSTTANGTVGMKKISTTGQMANNTSGTQRGQNPTTTKPVGGGQDTGRLSTAATGTATNPSKTRNTQTASTAPSGKAGKAGRATVGSSDSSRNQAMSQLPKGKQESIKNKTTQNDNAAIASRKPVDKNSGTGSSSINKTKSFALAGDVAPVSKGQAVTESKLLTDPDPAIRKAAGDLVANRPLTPADINALNKAAMQAAANGNVYRVQNLSNLIVRNEQLNALTGSITGLPLLGGAFPFNPIGGGGVLGAVDGFISGFAPAPIAEVASGIIEIIDGVVGDSLGIPSACMSDCICVVPEIIPVDTSVPFSSCSGYCMSIQDCYTGPCDNYMTVPVSYTSDNATTAYQPVNGELVDLTSQGLIEPVTDDDQKMFDEMYAGIDLDPTTMQILQAGWQNSSTAKRRADYEAFMAKVQSDQDAGTTQATSDDSTDVQQVTPEEQKMFDQMYAGLDLDAQTMKILEEGWQNSTSAQRKADYDAFMAKVASSSDADSSTATANYSADLAQTDEDRSAELPIEFVSQQIAPITAVTHRTRYFRLANITKESVTLSLQYYTEDQDGQWNWFPQANVDNGEAITVELDPGEVTDLEIDGWRLNASKVRIWGSSTSGQEWKKFKNQDLVIVPETDITMKPSYLSETKQTFCFTVK